MGVDVSLLVTGHSGEEVLAIEGVEQGVSGRLHGRRARHVAEQGDLAEEVSRAGRTIRLPASIVSSPEPTK